MNHKSSTQRKPSTQVAMQELITEVREVFPFDAPESTICHGICIGCSKKLLAYMEMELETWQERIDHGEVPSLGDLSSLGRSCKKIYKVLKLNGLV